MWFKERSCPHIIKVHSEASASDVEGEANCTEDLMKMIVDSCYTKQKRSVDSTTFDRKKMPTGSSVASENLMSGIRGWAGPSKDKCIQ